MNKETMRKHYERTPKDILINILISSREEVEKLQKRNKERKQEIERLNNIIKELNYGIKELDDMFYETFRISQNGYYSISEWELKEFTDKIKELKGEDKE